MSAIQPISQRRGAFPELLTIIAQLRKPTSIVMLIHVREGSKYFRRTRFEYGLVIWSNSAFVSEKLRATIAYNISPAGKQ